VSRPRSKQPTPAELEILKVLWEREPATAREVLEVLNADGNRRAYTTIASLMNVMVEKRFLTREPEGRAYRYATRLPRKKTLTGILSDLVGRAFEGSASALVAHLLDDTTLSDQELHEIRRTIERHEHQQR
jgi:predicted transcriptional regulator